MAGSIIDWGLVLAKVVRASTGGWLGGANRRGRRCGVIATGFWGYLFVVLSPLSVNGAEDLPCNSDRLPRILSGSGGAVGWAIAAGAGAAGAGAAGIAIAAGTRNKPKAANASGGGSPRSSREGETSVPYPITDDVHFTLTTARALSPGTFTFVDFWAHLDSQRKAVLKRIGESADAADFRIKTEGPAEIARGSQMTISVSVPQFEVKVPRCKLRWGGRIGMHSFSVWAPPAIQCGQYPGLVRVKVDGITISNIEFLLDVVPEAAKSAATALRTKQKNCRSAFASYAHEDRDEVVGIIQGMKKAVPDLNVFLDVMTLRAGTRWEEELLREVTQRDIFYLFWSMAASQSEWVEREWRHALRCRGLDFIDPVPLKSSVGVSPPAELRQLHFGDPIIVYR